MERRRFLAGLGAALLAAPRPGAAQQQPSKTRRIATLSYPTAQTPAGAALMAAFRDAMRELGWIDGQNIVIERRATEVESLPQVAAQLVLEDVDLILTAATPAARAARNATTSIPILMVVSADPIAGGVVDRIAQPGGNVTGLTLMAPELAGKRLELLREVAPRMRRAAAVVTSRHDAVAARWLHDSEAAAGRLGLGFRIAEVGRGREQWDAAFAALRQDGVGGVTIVEGPRSFEERSHIAASALKHGLATALPFRAQVEAGGLLSYGANLTEMYRRAATLADKILRGTPPSAIPVEQPTKFDLVINLGTAKALGLTIPPSLLVRADQVIE